MVEAELAESMLGATPPRIEVTADVELARLRGAAALVLQRHTESKHSVADPSKGKSVRKRKSRAADNGARR